jgi:hypothetical protein
MHKPQTGEHSKRTPQEADQLIRSMATRWSDADIAATLNRLAIPTGVGNTWTPGRVTAYRHNTGIPADHARHDPRAPLAGPPGRGQSALADPGHGSRIADRPAGIPTPRTPRSPVQKFGR